MTITNNGTIAGGGGSGDGRQGDEDDGEGEGEYGAGGHAGQPGVAAGGAAGAARFAVKRNGHSGPVTGGTVLGPVG